MSDTWIEYGPQDGWIQRGVIRLSADETFALIEFMSNLLDRLSGDTEPLVMIIDDLHGRMEEMIDATGWCYDREGHVLFDAHEDTVYVVASHWHTP